MRRWPAWKGTVLPTLCQHPPTPILTHEPSQGGIKFSTTFAGSSTDAYRLCGERLAQYQRERHGPTMVIGMGGALGFDPRQWRRAIPVLNDFPMCVMPPNSTDDLYPAIGWSMFAAERMVQRFLMFPRLAPI